MTQKRPRFCWHCGEQLPGEPTHFCPECGAADRSYATSDSISKEQAFGDAPEVFLGGSGQLHLSDEYFTLPGLLEIVQREISRLEQQLKEARGVVRKQIESTILELSRTCEKLVGDISRGHRTARITSRLPKQRHYGIGCPLCGRGNPAGSRFCAECGTLLAEPPKTPQTTRYVLACAGLSDVGKVRENNEDAWYIGKLPLVNGEDATLLLVADGMGGAQAGEQASELARAVMVQELASATQKQLPEGDDAWQTLLRQAAEAANQRIYVQAKHHISQRGMGTTLTALLVTDGMAHLVHVGDSRCYLLNRQGVADDGGQWVQLSTDHTLAARLIDIGHITAEEARKLPQRNMLYRALGVEETVACDLSSHRLSQGDIMVLCSDGLTTHVESPEIANVVFTASSPEHACSQLVDLANARGGKDNISVIVAKVTATVQPNRGSP